MRDSAIRSTWHTACPFAGRQRRAADRAGWILSLRALRWPYAGTNIYHAAGNTLYMLDLSTGHETILSRSFAPQENNLPVTFPAGCRTAACSSFFTPAAIYFPRHGRKRPSGGTFAVCLPSMAQATDVLTKMPIIITAKPKQEIFICWTFLLDRPLFFRRIV